MQWLKQAVAAVKAANAANMVDTKPTAGKNKLRPISRNRLGGNSRSLERAEKVVMATSTIVVLGVGIRETVSGTVKVDCREALVTRARSPA